MSGVLDRREEQADAKAGASFHGGWIIDMHIVIIFTNLAGIFIGAKQPTLATAFAASNSLQRRHLAFPLDTYPGHFYV